MGAPDARVPRRGRGATLNPEGRFEPRRLEPVEDRWWIEDEAPSTIPTTVTPEATRTILTRNDSPDLGFDRSINPYRGCEHGCVYCFARPTHAFLGLSPGIDFETKLFSKPDAARLLDGELRRPGYRCAVVVLGANTDAYQPVERDLKITRGVLEVLAAFNHPVTIVTKSSLVVRDLDLLAPMAARRLANVAVSVTTLDADLARRMEPRAATPERRLRTIRALVDSGVPVSVLAAPMIPAINDAELESILEAAARAGARRAGYVLIRLPHELKDLFADWLRVHHPLRADKVLSLIRETRGGDLYDAAFGRRMKGSGPYADLLAQRFATACRRLGISGRDFDLDSRVFDLETTLFKAPPRAGDQIGLFESKG